MDTLPPLGALPRIKRQAEVELKGDQPEAVEFIKSHNNGIIVINGNAGSGKTTAVRHAIHGQAGLSAPTHQAASVLREKSSMPARTIQSVLCVSVDQKARNDNGLQIFKQRDSPKFDYYDTLVVDEASMLSTQLLGYVEEYQELMQKRHGACKVVLIGDEKQLNPIGEVNSPCFHKGYPEFKMSQIIRQADGNDNIDLSMNLDMLYDYEDGKFYKWQDDINLDLLIDPSHTTKYLTWTNARVDLVNNRARLAALGKTAEDYEYTEGETIIVTEPNGSAYFTNEEVVIKRVVSNHMQTKFGTLYYYDINNEISVVAKRSVNTFNKMLKTIARMCANQVMPWKDYWKLKENFAGVQYKYGMTVHRSQGSTFDNCIVDTGDILRNPNKVEQDRMIYTALTRTANMNYLV